jgi:hypothetical protein
MRYYTQYVTKGNCSYTIDQWLQRKAVLIEDWKCNRDFPIARLKELLTPRYTCKVHY